jgi:transcriptional regulator with XRE-family HTH domain
MPTKNSDRHTELLRNFDRGMLRSAFASLFWAVISERRKRGFKLKELADALDCDKSQVSRWFSNEPPNWQIDTIADVAGALNLDLRVEGVDRLTGQVYTPAGVSPATTFMTSASPEKHDPTKILTETNRSPFFRGSARVNRHDMQVVESYVAAS